MNTVSRAFTAFGVMLFLGAGLEARAATSVDLRKNSSGESYLTDSRGMTLYYYTKDEDGQSACTDGCLKAWPVFYADSPNLPSPLQSSDFGTITRPDNTKQTTYRGWPLYYWVKDLKPGDMTGEGVGKVWYILTTPPYTVMLSTDKALGTHLVDGQGRSLYWFTKDPPGASDGTGARNAAWPAFAPDSFKVPSALNPADFTMITRGDGTRQAAYKGYPLYYFAKDLKRGDINGQDLGKAWYLVDPANFPAAGM